MTIFLNGEIKSLESSVSVTELIAAFGLPDKRVAVEVNHSVIRRADWPETVITDDDRIEIIHFVGGG